MQMAGLVTAAGADGWTRQLQPMQLAEPGDCSQCSWLVQVILASAAGWTRGLAGWLAGASLRLWLEMCAFCEGDHL